MTFDLNKIAVMRLILIVMILISLALPRVSFSDAGDETLEYYLSKSDLVVLGVILNQNGPIFYEEGVPNYYSDVKIDYVLKGNNELRGKTIKINIVRLAAREKYTENYIDLIKEGEERIFFLKKIPQNRNPAWRTADVWFGVQYPSSTMADAIKRLTKEEKNIEQ